MFIFSKGKEEKGFTLIEVLLAISILGIIATATMSFFSQAFDYTKRNESKTVGVNVARNVLNYMEGQDFDSVKSLIEANPPQKLTYENCALDGCEAILQSQINNVTYNATVTFPVVTEPDLVGQIINVKVTVDWPTNQSTTLNGVIQR